MRLLTGAPARRRVLAATAAAAIAAAWLAPRVAQDPAYHDLADARSFLGVPRAADTFSNLAILLGSLAGYAVLRRGLGVLPCAVGSPFERAVRTRRLVASVFFLTMAGTAFGSAWYHLAPDDARLVWDRLPIALGTVTLLVWVLVERVSVDLGRRLLAPLLLLAGGSVGWWARTEAAGVGDLRPYALVQFYPVVAIPLVLLLFRPGQASGFPREASPLSTRSWWLVLAAYAVARLGEVLDHPIFTATAGLVSGHTLKHLASGVAIWLIARGLAHAGEVGRAPPGAAGAVHRPRVKQ